MRPKECIVGPIQCILDIREEFKNKNINIYFYPHFVDKGGGGAQWTNSLGQVTILFKGFVILIFKKHGSFMNIFLTPFLYKI